MSEYFTEQEQVLINDAESALTDGVQLKNWWEQKNAANSYAEKFELVQTFNEPNQGFGFFDEVSIGSRNLRVMGAVQDMLFDDPKQSAPTLVKDEFREFILHYFMRVSDFRLPEASVNQDNCPTKRLNPVLQPLSWCDQDEDTRVGFGYSQLYYKLKGSGQVGRFSVQDEAAIVDLREIGTKYEWILAKVNIFDFNLKLSPFGDTNPSVVVPLKEDNYLVLSKDFITHQESSPDLLGRYGFGYALIKYATSESILAYGPGRFKRGFQLINFDVDRKGQTHARLAFVVNRPEKILSIDIDPLKWGFDLFNYMSLGLAGSLFGPVRNTINQLPFRINDFDPLSAYITWANLMTAGIAADEFCVELKQLEKEMLVQHFMQHYSMIVNALLTWRQIPNWLDETSLPEWVKTGVSE